MKFYFCINHSHSLRMKLRMYVAHEEVQSLVNILTKSFRTNLNMIPERNDLEISFSKIAGFNSVVMIQLFAHFEIVES